MKADIWIIWKRNGKIIYDSDHGRIVMSTQAISAEKDIFFNNIIDYLKEARKRNYARFSRL